MSQWFNMSFEDSKITAQTPSYGLMALIFVYFLLLTLNSFITANLPFYSLVLMIKKNHQQKGLSLLSIKLFVLSLIVFSALNAIFTCILDTSEFTTQASIKSAWLVILGLRVGLGVVQMVYLFILEDNETKSGEKMENLIQQKSFNNEKSENHVIS